MLTLFNRTKFYIYLIGTFLLLPFFFWWASHAANDLLWQLFFGPDPISQNHNDTMLNIGENIDSVWKKVIKWSYEVGFGWGNSGVGKSASIIVKITRLLLILTIALSVTMILYNWMIYIIQTWQWKEWKSLIKNVIYIVIGILVSLSSVVIINLIQSIPTTLDNELIKDYNNKTDNAVLWKRMKLGDIRKSIIAGKDDSSQIKEYGVTIEYVDNDGNNLSSRNVILKNGVQYRFVNPEIIGYEPESKILIGVADGETKTLRVTYTPVNGEEDDDFDREAAIQEAIEYFTNETDIEPYAGDDWNRYVDLRWSKVEITAAYLSEKY